MSFEVKKVWQGLKSWLEEDVSRFLWDVVHLPFPRQFNPYDQKLRPAYKDITHAFVNIFVEFYRKNAYTLGHLMSCVWMIVWALIILHVTKELLS